MVRVEADDPILASHIEKHARALVSCGGWIHDELVIRCHGGDISVFDSGAGGGSERLLLVPKEALAPVAKSGLAVRGGEIFVDEASVGLSATQRLFLDLQCEIFNRADKIGALLRRLPKYALRDHEDLLIALSERQVPDAEASARDVESGLDRPVGDVLSDFLRTRVLRWPSSNATGDAQDVLMSFIDYLNHHSFAPPYQRSVDKNDLIATRARHDPDGGECFVRYGPYDAQDLLVQHGFVDESAHFVRSASFDVEVEDFGVLHVGADIDVQSPKTVSDRAFDMPGRFPLPGKRALEVLRSRACSSRGQAIKPL